MNWTLIPSNDWVQSAKIVSHLCQFANDVVLVRQVPIKHRKLRALCTFKIFSLPNDLSMSQSPFRGTKHAISCCLFSSEAFSRIFDYFGWAFFLFMSILDLHNIEVEISSSRQFIWASRSRLFWLRSRETEVKSKSFETRGQTATAAQCSSRRMEGEWPWSSSVCDRHPSRPAR